MKSFLSTSSDHSTSFFGNKKTYILTQADNRNGLMLPLVALLGFVSVLIFMAYQLVYFLTPFNFPFWGIEILVLSVLALPLVWLHFWKNHRFCFVAASLILLVGDIAPPIFAPMALAITLPNFIYLLYLYRKSRIKYLLLPYLLISGIYFANSFLLNFIDNPIMVVDKLHVNIGFLGAFGGFLMVYFFMYFPLILYHFACQDRQFFQTSGFILSLIINFITLVGLFQFITDFLFFEIPDSGIIRIKSIMRRATRFGPFLASSLPILINGLLIAKTPQSKIYWWISIVLSVFMLLLTSTRGAIGAAGVIYVSLLFTFLLNRSFKTLGRMLLITLLLGALGGLLGHSLGINYFARFESEKIQTGLSKRQEIINIYTDLFESRQASSPGLVKAANILFGYGWFSERDIGRDPHNTFLSAFSSFGLVGTCLFYIPMLWLLSFALRQTLKRERFDSRPEYGMVCAMIMFFLISGVVHNKLYSPIESAYVWLIIGVLLNQDLLKLFPPGDTPQPLLQETSRRGEKYFIALK